MNREIRDLLRDVARGEIGPAVSKRAQDLLDGKPPPGIARPPGSLGTAYAEIVAHRIQRRTERERTKLEMHEDVWAWNIEHGATCDCGCGYRFRHADEGECDHWLERSQGGEHTRENGWRLSHVCHRMKTDNHPDRADWNERRRAYCQRAGIPFVSRKEKHL